MKHSYISKTPETKEKDRVIDTARHRDQSESIRNIQHLRRLIKSEHLPEHLQIHFASTLSAATPKAVARQSEDVDHNDNGGSAMQGPGSLHLLICATQDLSIERVRALLTPDGLPLWTDEETTITTITVPAQAPSSESESKQWSQQYWPTIYKKHNPFGAHPSIISRATAEIEENVTEFMDLATKVGQQASDVCVGEAIGAVVVDRSEAAKPTVLMVAGDARWNLGGKDPERKNGNGNVMAHAVMRAIALVAKKRQEVSSNPPATRPDVLEDAFTDCPLTPLEKQTYAATMMKPGGYLCLDLEFYLTHEPCVMCSMALLHSRVGRVVFEKKMVLTGGLTAGEEESQEGGLGYGLFWRPSLNWKFLTWQWSRSTSLPLRSLDIMHA